MSPIWHQEAFLVPHRTYDRSRTPGKEGDPLPYIQDCKALLLDPVDAYKMGAVTRALRNAHPRTLAHVLKETPHIQGWIKFWLEVFNLVFRHIVDANSGSRVENDKDTRNIFMDMLRWDMFKGERMVCEEVIYEYFQPLPGHIKYLHKQQGTRFIDKWSLPGWLPDDKEEKGKPPQESWFHQILVKESPRVSNLHNGLRELEGEFCKEFAGYKKELGDAENVLNAARRGLDDAERAVKAAWDEIRKAKDRDKPAMEKAAIGKYEAAKKRQRTAEEKYEVSKERYQTAGSKYEVAKAQKQQDPEWKLRLEEMAARREQVKEDLGIELQGGMEHYQRKRQKEEEKKGRKVLEGENGRKEREERDERKKKKPNRTLSIFAINEPIFGRRGT